MYVHSTSDGDGGGGGGGGGGSGKRESEKQTLTIAGRRLAFWLCSWFSFACFIWHVLLAWVGEAEWARGKLRVRGV